MEIVLATLISSIFGLIGLMMWQRNKEKNLQLKKEYEIDMYKLKKRETRKDKKLGSTIKTTPDRGIMDLIGGLDRDKITGVLDLLQGSDGNYSMDQDEPSNDLGVVGDLINSNPDLVKSFVDGFVKKQGSQDQTQQLDFE